LFGRAPERVEQRPAEGVESANVSHLGGNVQITVNPLRVDVIYQAGPMVDTASPDKIGSIGTDDVGAVLKWMKGAAPKLLGLVPDVVRIGVVVTLNEEFDSKEESARALVRRLPEDLKVPSDAEDFAIQFNRRRPSKFYDGHFNVMSGWQIAARQDFIFGNAEVKQQIKYAVRSMVDANTAHGDVMAAQALSSEHARDVAVELIEAAFPG